LVEKFLKKISFLKKKFIFIVFLSFREMTLYLFTILFSLRFFYYVLLHSSSAIPGRYSLGSSFEQINLFDRLLYSFSLLMRNFYLNCQKVLSNEERSNMKNCSIRGIIVESVYLVTLLHRSATVERNAMANVRREKKYIMQK